jgi:predicted ATPase
MPAYILTGAPGAGKTAVLRLLETLGYPVVEEAATDVIALGNALGQDEPWRVPGFIDQIVTLQRQRQLAARTAAATVFFDRSPVCTLALSRWLNLPASPLLTGEVGRILAEGTYEMTALFLRNQGFVAPTAARRISFADCLAFERVHEQAYRDLGFQLIDVPPGPLADRAELIRQAVSEF